MNSHTTINHSNNRLSITIIVLLFPLYSVGQQNRYGFLDPYKYFLAIPYKVNHPEGDADVSFYYNTISNTLLTKGLFKVPNNRYYDSINIGGSIPFWVRVPSEVLYNPCLIVRWYISISAQELKLFAINCKAERIFEKAVAIKMVKIKKSHPLPFDRYRSKVVKRISKSLQKALAEVKNMPYSFDEELSHRLFLNQVELTSETEQSLKDYFRVNHTEPLEGIYKSFGGNPRDPSYKIGIKKINGTYKAIIVESSINTWKAGEVKATFEKTSTANLFSTKIFSADKKSFDTFAELDDAILTITLPNKVGVNQKMEFLKLALD